MDPLLILLTLSIVVVAGALFLLSRRRTPTSSEEPSDEASGRQQRPQRAGLGGGGGRTRRNRLLASHVLQQRRRRGARDESPEDVPTYRGESEDDMMSMIDEEMRDLPAGKIGKKKLLKLQEKEERAAKREEEMQKREDKKKREEEKMEERRLKEKEREEEEERKAEEERKRKEEQEKREQEEYERLKSGFSVEEEGAEQLDEEESQSLLQEFIAYIKETKVVMLEDLAAHFSLKTQDAISRLQTLLDEGLLEGMMDDRGKFIYLTVDELAAVAKYIRQNGRVAICDLAEASTNLVNLKPVRESTVIA